MLINHKKESAFNVTGLENCMTIPILNGKLTLYFT